jgi:serine/threonine protein kinase
MEPDEITNQVELLATHRSTLSYYLMQRAKLGLYTPPGVFHGISEAREQIRALKTNLRTHGMQVDDQLGDDTQPISTDQAEMDPFPVARDDSLNPSAQRLPRFQNGQIFLSRFAIRGFVGRGGFSDAYIVWDRVHDQEVVIKLLATENDNKYHKRFVDREIKMARVIPHDIPGLVSTSEVIPFQDGVCFVQKRIPGESLGNRLEARKVIETGEALTTIIKLCETLEQLHGRKIAHCDIKPLNIMIPSPGNPILIDLGTARSFSEKLGREEIVISIPYSSIELLTGKPIDGRVDIFSLGMTLLHMLVGQDEGYSVNYDTFPGGLDVVTPPSKAEVTEYIEQRMRHVWPDSLKSILARSLAIEPKNRYRQVQDLRDALVQQLA